jgi:hypothetical protein
METIPEENEVLEENEPITEVVDKGNETDESDESLNSLELSELQNTLTKSFEDPDPIIIKPTEPVIIKPKKATRGRPKLAEDEKKAKKVVIKEKRIYMVKDDSTGEYKEQKIKPLTERQLKKIELEKKNTELEIEIGKKLARTKKGKVDNRSVKERTPAQIAHSKKLVELNRLRREKKTAEKKDSLDKSIDESVKKSIVQVITAPKEMIKEVKPEWVAPPPPPPPKKTDKEIYNDFFG